METLPDFTLLQPKTLAEALEAHKGNPGSRLLGGGTDLIVNLRRGIGDDPETLIDMTRISELKTIEGDEKALRVGASVTLDELANNKTVNQHFPALSQTAADIAGPTHQTMGTVGGNLCLDTRCVYYNQSDWWRSANDFCLKYQGEQCHVALKSKICFATFSGDLAAAALIYHANIEIVGVEGKRTIALNDLYTGDGKDYLTLNAGEIVTALIIENTQGLKSAYDKVRTRQSIDYPVAGVAVGLVRDGDMVTDLRVAITGTNPRPVLLEGTSELSGKLDDVLFEGLERLVKDQIMSMKTTLTPGHYRRRVAGVMAKRLIERLF
jgi:4-hydroxybenzoyl-CoA reductase subunit beta